MATAFNNGHSEYPMGLWQAFVALAPHPHAVPLLKYMGDMLVAPHAVGNKKCHCKRVQALRTHPTPQQLNGCPTSNAQHLFHSVWVTVSVVLYN